MFRKLPKTSLLPYYLALLGTSLIWAAASPVIKITLEYIPPLTFLMFRFIVVGIVLLPYTVITLKRVAIHKNDIVKIIILGVVSQSSLAFIFIGLQYTSVIEATIVALLGPLLSVAAGNYFYHEKVTKQLKIGLLIATLGTLFVAAEPLLNAGPTHSHIGERLLGNFFIILYALSNVAYLVWSKIMLGNTSKEIKRFLKHLHMKQFNRKYSPILITALSFYVGLATLIPFAFLENTGFIGDFYFSLDKLTFVPIMGILFMALLSSIVAYFLYEWSLEKVAIKDSAIFTYLSPILTLPFAFLLLGETPNQFMIAGGLFIALGVAIAEFKKS